MRGAIGIMKKRIFQITYISLFLLICTLPLFTMLLPQKNTLLENRVLSSMPQLFKGHLLNTNFTNEFNTYFSENFGLRPYLVTAYSKLNYNLFKVSVNEKVIPGKNDWLYFNETLKDYTGDSKLSSETLEQLYRILYLQQEYLNQYGIKFIFTIAPNKNSIYGEFMPLNYINKSDESNLQLINEYFSDKELNYINLYEALKKEKSALPNESDITIYHKKDTHWNNYGAKIAYNELMQEVKKQLPDYYYNDYSNLNFIKKSDWKGDLEVMLFPTAKHEDDQYYFNIDKSFAYTRPLRSYEDLSIISNSDANSYRLFMFRDSFANALIQFISNNFGYAHYSRIYPIDYNIVLNDAPNIAILEIVERNISSLLEQAPIMPAPERTELKRVQPKTVKDIEVVVKTEDSGDYIKIYGFANSSASYSLKNKTIYVKITSASDEYFFEPFPVLEENLRNSTEYTDKTSNKSGFSMLLDKKYIQNKDFDVQIIIKSQNNYICPDRLLLDNEF